MLSLDLDGKAGRGAPPGHGVCSCESLQAAMSAYVDGELESGRAGVLIHHLEWCSECSRRLQQYRDLRQCMQALPAPAPPPDLALRLRVEASHFSVRGQRWEYWKMRLEMALQALAVPATVGTAVALFLLTAFAGGVRGNLVANPLIPDVAVGGDASPARLTSASSYGVDASVLVEANIDATGHVYGYRVLAGPTDAGLISRLNNQLLLSAFQPAMTSFGQPTTGSVLVSFGTVEVRG